MKIELQPTIQIDTREKLPLAFHRFKSEVCKLDFGDYGIKGHSDLNNPGFIIERKSLSDLIGSLTCGRDRFFREVEGLRRFRFAGLVIEADRSDVETGGYRSAANPGAILASLDAIQVRAGIHVLWCGTPGGAARCVESLVSLHVRGLCKQLTDLLPADVRLDVKEDKKANSAEVAKACH